VSFRSDTEEEERPLGTRRSSTRPGTGPRRPAPGRRHTVGRALTLLALLLTAAAVLFLVELFQPFTGSGHGSVVVRIPAGAGASKIGDELSRQGVVDSGFLFDLRASLSGKRGKLRSGAFALKRDMSYSAAITALTTIPPRPKIALVTLTVPEGRTIRQETPRLRAAGLPGDYAAAARRSPALDPRRYGAPSSTPSLEGFLFPATYQLRAPGSAAALVTQELTAFKARFRGVSLGYARARHLTAYDVLIVASMVEGEAKTARDRPLIAAVIYNRLHDRMPLGIDATLRYGLNNYDRPLTVSELASPSPYNTRKQLGLPPTPIGSPGLASIRAAARPARVPYLYFVVKPGACGGHVFSTNYQQFLSDSARYNAARQSLGGRSPEKCPA